jgi:hypothetical protein
MHRTLATMVVVIAFAFTAATAYAAMPINAAIQ